jgi:exportin-5
VTWGDSTGSLKATGLVGGVVLELVQRDRVSSELGAHILTSVLLGLQQHGQHDANQGSLLLLGIQLYTLLRPLSPLILEVSIISLLKKTQFLPISYLCLMMT